MELDIGENNLLWDFLEERVGLRMVSVGLLKAVAPREERGRSDQLRRII